MHQRHVATTDCWRSIAWRLKNPFSQDFTSEIRSQVIESSFALGSEVHRNHSFGSFFNSHSRYHSQCQKRLLTERLAGNPETIPVFASCPRACPGLVGGFAPVFWALASAPLYSAGHVRGVASRSLCQEPALSEVEGLGFHAAKSHCVPPNFFITFFPYADHRHAPQSVR